MAEIMMHRFTLQFTVATLLGFGLLSPAGGADALPIVIDVEYQPLVAQVERVSQALELAGAPLSSKQKKGLAEATTMEDRPKAIRAIQEVLDPLCVVGVDINPESRVKVQP